MTNNNPFSADAYLIASMIVGIASLVGAHLSIEDVTTFLLSIVGLLGVIIPPILAFWRQIHHMKLSVAPVPQVITLRPSSVNASASSGTSDVVIAPPSTSKAGGGDLTTLVPGISVVLPTDTTAQS